MIFDFNLLFWANGQNLCFLVAGEASHRLSVPKKGELWEAEQTINKSHFPETEI